MGAARKENQESEALMLLLLKFWDVCDITGRGISDGCLHLEHVMVAGCSARYRMLHKMNICVASVSLKKQ